MTNRIIIKLLVLLVLPFTGVTQNKMIRYYGFGGDVSFSSFLDKPGSLNAFEALAGDTDLFFYKFPEYEFSANKKFTWLNQKGLYFSFRLDSSLFRNPDRTHDIRLGFRSFESSRNYFVANYNNPVKYDTLLSNAELQIDRKTEVARELTYGDNYRGITIYLAYLTFINNHKRFNLGYGIELESEYTMQSSFISTFIADTTYTFFYGVKSDSSLNYSYKETVRKRFNQNEKLPSPLFVRISIPLILNLQLPKTDNKPNHLNAYIFCKPGADFQFGPNSHKEVRPLIRLGMGVNYCLF